MTDIKFHQNKYRLAKHNELPHPKAQCLNFNNEWRYRGSILRNKPYKEHLIYIVPYDSQTGIWKWKSGE